jgi:putative Mg2+ transporter-C (MgtC) family protein
MVMMTNQFIIKIYGDGDPARLGVQVISGIGFLGAGTIIVTRRNQVRGLTTAAGLWSAACLGLALGNILKRCNGLRKYCCIRYQ